MRWFFRFVLALLAFGALVWLGNTNAFITLPADQQPRLIAHRGVHQIYAGADRDAATCNANPIRPLTHQYIANTLPSIRAAFAAGADVVEVDVHLTPDPVFAVFHDWTLDCQTDGQGVTHKQNIDELRKRDLGYGYSVDGETFPLRGTGIGAMPVLSEVFDAADVGPLLINFKGNRAIEGAALADMLENPAFRAKTFGVYGGAEPTRAALAGTPGLVGFDRPALKDCLLRYVAVGWTGYVPQVCRDRIIAVPMDYAPYLWGWPHRFTDRMKAAGTEVILWGPYDGSGFSSGVDDVETLAQVPPQFDGYIWTNRIEVIGPMMKHE